MVMLEGVVFTDKSRIFLCDNTCPCDDYIDLKNENQKLKSELAACIKVYEKEQEQKEVIRLLSERILVLESQNRVYAEIIERGKNNDKRA